MRRTKEQAEETRKAILKSAFWMFTENEYSQVSLNSIAERAGLTKGAFYWHFKNKNDVLLSLVREMCAQDEKDFYAALAMPESDETLASFYEKVLNRGDSSECYSRWHKLLRRRFEWPAEIQEQTNSLLQESLEHERGIVKGYISRGQDKGTIRNDVQADKISMVLTTILNSLRAMQVGRMLTPEYHDCLNFLSSSFKKELAAPSL